MANRVIKLSAVNTKKSNKVLYRDIAFGNNINNTDKVKSITDIKAIQNSLHNIFTWRPGERILNPTFGSDLYKYLYEGITKYNTEQIIAAINSIVTTWEPRIKIEKIFNLTEFNDIENNSIHIQIIYSIPSLENNEEYAYDYFYNRTA